MSRACEGVRLCVIDTFSRFHSGDENSNADMGAVIGHAELITERTGACILGLHHTSKNAAMNGQQAAQQSTRGASAIVDNARWQGYLEGMSPTEAKKLCVPEDYRRHFVSFGISKQNYGRPVSPRWLAKLDKGVLLNCPEGTDMLEAVEYLKRTQQSPPMTRSQNPVLQRRSGSEHGTGQFRARLVAQRNQEPPHGPACPDAWRRIRANLRRPQGHACAPHPRRARWGFLR
jgi:hypothetical protein